MYNQIVPGVINQTELMQKYEKLYNLEEHCCIGLVTSYVEHLKHYDSWEQVRYQCLAIEHVISNYLENNIFTAEDFGLIRCFADMLFNYHPFTEDEHKWEVFELCETIIRAYETATGVGFESIKGFYRVAKYGLEYLLDHREDEAVKMRVRNFLESVCRMLSQQNDSRRIKYGYKLVKIYKELTLDSDNPKEWLFDLLFCFGEVVRVEQRLEEKNHKRVIEKTCMLIQLLLGKINGLEKRREDYTLNKRSYDEVQMTVRANLWARGLVHLCHVVHALYDHNKASAQRRAMREAIDMLLVNRLTKGIAEKLIKDNDNRDSMADIQNKAFVRARREFEHLRHQGGFMGAGFSHKEKLHFVENYITAQKFEPMITECEMILKTFKAIALPIDSCYIKEMTQLVADLNDWALNCTLKEAWAFNLDDRRDSSNHDVFMVFYGVALRWNLRDEKRVL